MCKISNCCWNWGCPTCFDFSSRSDPYDISHLRLYRQLISKISMATIINNTHFINCWTPLYWLSISATTISHTLTNLVLIINLKQVRFIIVHVILWFSIAEICYEAHRTKIKGSAGQYSLPEVRGGNQFPSYPGFLGPVHFHECRTKTQSALMAFRGSPF